MNKSIDTDLNRQLLLERLQHQRQIADIATSNLEPSNYNVHSDLESFTTLIPQFPSNTSELLSIREKIRLTPAYTSIVRRLQVHTIIRIDEERVLALQNPHQTIIRAKDRSYYTNRYVRIATSPQWIN